MRVDFPRAIPACSKNGAGIGPATSRTFSAVIKSGVFGDNEVGVLTELERSLILNFASLELTPETKINMSAPTTTPVNGITIFET
jgi:hypothetical protein